MTGTIPVPYKGECFFFVYQLAQLVTKTSHTLTWDSLLFFIFSRVSVSETGVYDNIALKSYFKEQNKALTATHLLWEINSQHVLNFL